MVLTRLRGLFSAQPAVSARERVAAALSALAALLALALIATWWRDAGAMPFMVASMGASAVLLFAVPHSPLAQPWPMLGGHLVSALAGVTCAQLVPSVPVALAAAGALAIALMFSLRCLHPPGGATALVPVLGGEALRSAGYAFVLNPVLLNAAVLVLLAWAINRLVPGRRWPAVAQPARESVTEAEGLARGGLTSADLQVAIKEMGAFIDVSQTDLEQIFTRAMLHSRARSLGEHSCASIMQREVATAQFGDNLEDVWAMLREDRLKGVVVVDRARRVIGIVTIIDFLKQAGRVASGKTLERLRALLTPTASVTSDKPEVVGQIMSAPVITVQHDAHIVTLIPLFTGHAIHHVPVLDDERRLVGIVTQTGLMAALDRLRGALS
ncbi:MAG: HPP family protein [Pseudomonadota bacterium]|nr:MAG: HPP family protein [Pseudomonadota bacterium]